MEGLTTALTALLGVWLASVVVSRPLQTRFSWPRRIVAGVVAWSTAVPIVRDIAPAHLGRRLDPLLLWYVLVGTMAAVLAAMVLLVLGEVLVPSGSWLGPVAQLQRLPASWRRTRRFARIAGILTRHGLAAYVFTRRPPDLRGTAGKAHLARSMRAAMEDAGVTFVKLGQILSTRDDLLPPQLVTELRTLQSAARPVPWADIEGVLTAGLGAPPEDFFVELDHEPSRRHRSPRRTAASSPQARQSW